MEPIEKKLYRATSDTYLANGFLELDNNSAERAMKPVALGRKNWMFAGSQRGSKAMAIAFTLIETTKLNGVDPQAWLTDTLESSSGSARRTKIDIDKRTTIHFKTGTERETKWYWRRRVHQWKRMRSLPLSAI
jgi:hypothetical protein